MEPGSSYALVTAADNSFVEAADVMLFSFLRRNPWFHGKVLVIDSGLDPSARERLGRRHGKMEFIPPGDDLLHATAVLGQSVPRVSQIRPRFDKLELFRIEGFDRLVFLDGDILVNGSLIDLFETDIRLGACPERTSVFGDRRGRKTYRCYRAADVPSEPVLDREFNTGVMTVGPGICGPDLFRELIGHLSYDRWSEVVVPGIADQIVFNWCLAGRATPLSHAFNFMPRLESAIGQFHGIGWRDARVHHYADSFKPWLLRNTEFIAYRAPELFKYWELWKAEVQRMDTRPTDWDEERRHHDLLCRALMDNPMRVMNWRLDWRSSRSGNFGALPPEFEFGDDAPVPQPNEPETTVKNS